MSKIQCISKYLHQTIGDCLDKFSAYLLWWLLPHRAHRTPARRWRHKSAPNYKEKNWLAVANANALSRPFVRSLLLFRRFGIFNCIIVFFYLPLTERAWMCEWEEMHEWIMNPTYRSSKNINFISISARNMNIFWFSFISVTWECGSECPTATNPKFCTQLCASP